MADERVLAISSESQLTTQCYQRHAPIRLVYLELDFLACRSGGWRICEPAIFHLGKTNSFENAILRMEYGRNISLLPSGQINDPANQIGALFRTDRAV
jgi:hypothetical protein